MKKGILVLTVIAIFVLTISGVVVAENTVQLRAGYLNYLDDKIELSEGLTMIRGEVTVSALRGDYFREEQEAELEDEIEMTFGQGKIISRRLTAFLETNRYVFREEVEFTREQGPRIIVLKAPYLEVDEEADTFTAREGVEIDYEGRILRSREAHYEGESDQLQLSGDVEIEEDDGDWIRGQRAVFYPGAEEDSFQVEDEVELEIDLGS